MADQTVRQETFWRFSVLQRALHLIVILGFVGIGLTGFSMAFSSVAPARTFVWFLGGADSVRYLHRFFAVVMYLCVVTHVFWLFYYKFILGGDLFGPNSICFRKQDLLYFRDHIGYLLALRNAPPAFDRFTYWEKLDYWAIFIGMQSMSLTGLFLWFPEFFSRFLPGYFINIAQVLHFDEGVLAVLYIFCIHLTVGHWRPEVYPGDWTIFTGKTTKETMMKTHPGEWASLNPSPRGSAIGEK
ncbi:MAG: cytochrome b/b6 domain-containing protein [Deltaproteobacteria bacterium]|nr:cytochrome b/b6 domain-containing protein [Deltaproteobacteria bacterium]